MITVGILGPTVIAWDSYEVTLSTMGTVLALVLAVTPGNAAASGDIQHKAWPDREPDDRSAARLRSAVLAMRSRFAGALPQPPPRAACPPYRVVVAGKPGYRLPAVRTDADEFASLAGQARLSLQQDDPLAAWKQACDAMSLWRGDPLADASGRSFAVGPALRLERARHAAETVRCEAALWLGMHREITPDLEELAASWPGDFGLTCLLVTALARCGRIGQAADVCYKAIVNAQEQGFDDTPYRQLQYEVLNGMIPAAGAAWRPPQHGASAVACSSRRRALTPLPGIANQPGEFLVGRNGLGMTVAEVRRPGGRAGLKLAPRLVNPALPGEG
jgi:DNA-binding SARP family transcriptional activator